MRFCRTFLYTVALWIALSARVYAKSEYARHWTEYADAPEAYWLIAVFAAIVLSAFVLWVNFSSRFAAPGTVKRHVYYIWGGIMVIFVLMALGAYLAPPLIQRWGGIPGEDAWNWKQGDILTEPGSGLSGEPEAGYKVAVAEGCFQGSCHSMFVRPQDIPGAWEGSGVNDISMPEDFYYMKPPLWGTQRNGPDLTRVGKRIPSMEWHIKHIIAPRSVKPKSIMPAYSYLSKKQTHDLAAFLVSLGNDPKKIKQGVFPWAEETGGLSEDAKKGLKLIQTSGCFGCHTTDGAKSAGPTWKGLYGSKMEMNGMTIIADEEFIYESIVNPDAWVDDDYPANVMPQDFGRRFSDDEIGYIIKYIKSLGDD